MSNTFAAFEKKPFSDFIHLPKARQLAEKADRFLGKKDFAQAASYYQAAMLALRWDQSLHFRLGLALEGLERWDDAANAFREAFVLGEKHPHLPFHLGFCLAKVGVLSVAERLFKEQISTQPTSEAIQNLQAVQAALAASTPPLHSDRHAARQLQDKRRAIVRAIPLAEQTAAIERLESPPLISIVMPFYGRTPFDLVLLAHAVESVRRQTYPRWELCVCDNGSLQEGVSILFNHLMQLDSRIRTVHLTSNAGISGGTNAAAELASGNFLAFMDHDDELTADCLFEFATAIAAHPEADAFYSDHDKVDLQCRKFEPFYKPDWSPTLLRGVMYVCHLLAVRRTLFDSIGRFDSTFNKVQDFELMLRVGEHARAVVHIPKILYHWRAIPGSLSAGPEEKGGIGELQAAAVQVHLDRLGRRALALPNPSHSHRASVLPIRRTSWPRVSIVIPTKDRPDLIGRCLESIATRTAYPDMELIVVDTGSTDPHVFDIYRHHGITPVLYDRPRFNYSEANNLGVERATGEYVVFLNNDTEVMNKDWLEQMLFHAEEEGVGAVGPLLLYPGGSVQHAGVILGPRGTADHVMRFYPSKVDGYNGSLSCPREVSAVTAACLMMRTALFRELGGFEELYGMIYQDLDLCLKLRARGLRIIATPDAVLYHHESVSRGKDYNLVDRALLLEAWGDTILHGDPYYNPNFTILTVDYSEDSHLSAHGLL